MCLRPLYLRVDSTTFGKPVPILAPCGKCIECVIERQNAYKLRLCYEARRWKHTFFFTLTYRDSALPYALNEVTGEYVSTGCKTHVQSWLKVMRERYLRSRGCRFDFRYFICLEYGSEDYYIDDYGRTRKATGRPHYHGILFCNDSPEFLNEMFDEWRSKYGRVDASELKPTKAQPDEREHRSKVANYVAKYCCKGEFSTRVQDIEDGAIEPSWFILSNGIGSNYVDDMRDHHLCKDWLFRHPNIDNYLPEGAWTIDAVDYYFRSTRGTMREGTAEVLRDYLDEVVDRMVVYDGDAPYKMPRYFRQKIYGTKKRFKRIRTTGLSLKFDFDTWNKQESFTPLYGKFCRPGPVFTYESETYEVVVPTSENFLSAGIAYTLRNRFLERAEIEYREFLWEHRYEGVSKAIRKYTLFKLDEAKRRENAKRSKLKSFYYGKHLEHPELSA